MRQLKWSLILTGAIFLVLVVFARPALEIALGIGGLIGASLIGLAFGDAEIAKAVGANIVVQAVFTAAVVLVTVLIARILASTDKNGRPRLIWLERVNAPIYGTCIAIGVPWLSMEVSDEHTKLIIAAWWYAVAYPIYVRFEGREIEGQMSGRGAIKGRQALWQIITAFLPLLGAIIATFAWVANFYKSIPEASGWYLWVQGFPTALEKTPMTYGWVEWGIVVHTLYVWWISVIVFYAFIIDFLKATPRAERIETSIPQ